MKQRSEEKSTLLGRAQTARTLKPAGCGTRGSGADGVVEVVVEVELNVAEGRIGILQAA